MMKPNTQENYHRRIARVIATILDDPAAAHSVESLAAVANLSPFHFHRIYRAMTSEGVAETVRRLRLAQAANQLTWTDDGVMSVALDAGYESPQAFARAFRGFTGVSPGEFLSRQRALMDRCRPVEVQQVEIVEIQPTELFGLVHQGPIATISQTYRRLFEMVSAADLEMALLNQVGVAIGDPEGGDDFRYVAGVVASALTEPPPGLDAFVIEGGLYGVYRLTGPYALIDPTFRALFGGWLPNSGYEPDNRPALEFYRTQSSPGEQAGSITDLMIPIRSV